MGPPVPVDFLRLGLCETFFVFWLWQVASLVQLPLQKLRVEPRGFGFGTLKLAHDDPHGNGMYPLVFCVVGCKPSRG